MVKSSIIWESVPNNATNNSYLSCLSACDSVSIVPTGNYPSSVKYRVQGTISGGCAISTFYDTATVYFVNNIDVDIQPKNASICFGGSPATLTASPVGGLAPYHYTWNTGATTASISVATAGTYFVSMTDSLGCYISRDTVVVTSFTMPIAANAGNDTTICTRTNYASLNGSIQAAGGGRWSGGAGTFTPNDSALNAVYRPSAAEVTAGSVTLKLTTIRNGTCPADSDFVQIRIKPSPIPVVTGPSNACAYRTSSYSTYATNPSAGTTYQWNVTGGVIQGSSTDSIVRIQWNGSGTGTVTATQTSVFGCDSSVSKSVTIFPTPLPVITGPANVCAFKTSLYSTNTTSGNTYQWSVTGGTIQGSATDTAVTVKWNTNGAGSITVKQTNSFTCDSTASRTITINPTPAPVITGPATVCAFKTTTYTTNTTVGNTYQWSVTGGTILGTSTDTIVSVKWNTNGTGSVSLTQTNLFSCDSPVSRTITIRPTPAPVITGPATVCAFKTTTYTTNTTAGNTYQWSVAGGTILNNATDTIISVRWNGSGTGSVTLTQTNSFSCDSTVSRTITIRPTPAPVITGPAAVCAFKTNTYSTNTTPGNTYQWIVTGGTILNTATDTIISVRWNGAGAGSVSLTQTNSFSCDSSASRTITINPTPAPVITGPTTVCAFKTNTYTTNTASGNTYQWNVTGGTIQGSATDTTVSIKWNGSGTGSVTLTQTNSFSCDSAVSKTITIRPTPAPVITGTGTVCAFKITTYTTNTTVGNTYQWIVTGGAILGSATDTIINVKWNASGSGSVTLTQINAFSCDSTVNKTITIQPTPAPVITGPATVCAFKTNSYTTNTTSGNTYQWSVSGGTILGSATDTVVSIKWNASGAGSVTLTQTNSVSCDSTVSKTITIQPAPAPVITGPATVCAFKTNAYTTNTTSGNTYQWNVTGGTILGSSADTSISVRWNGSGSGSVTLTQTNSFSCDSTVSITITIRPTPAPIITGPATVCVFKANTYTTNTTSGNAYQWSVTGGIISGSTTDTIVTIRWNATGTGSVTLTQTNSFSCDSTVNKTIAIQPTPAPVITGPAIVCAYKTNTYTTNTSSGNSYQWNVTGGTISGSATDTILNVKWNSSGSGSVTLTQTNSVGCDSTVSRTITIRPTPASVITGPAAVCAFKTTIYTTNASAGNTYQWSVTGGTILGNATDTTISVRWNGSGAGSVTLTQTNSFSCDSTVNKTIVIQSTTAPVITGPVTVCAFKTNTYTTNTTSGNTYQWNVTGGIIQGSATDTTVTVKWNASGTGSVTLAQTNSFGCDSTVSKAIMINPTPAPVIIGPATVCAFKTTTYTTNTSTGYTYQWNVTGGTIPGNATDTTVRVQWNGSGSGSLTLTQTNSFSCDSTVSRTITIRPTPAPVITGPAAVCAFKTNTYSTNTTPGNTYQWIVTGGTILNTATDTIISVRWNGAGAGSVTLTQTNSFSCDSTISKTITIQPTPAPVITGPATVCAFKTSTYTTNTNSGNTYQWNVTGGMIQGSTTDTGISVRWNGSGSGSITLTQTNPFGCDSAVSRTITIRPTPAPVITGSATVCAFKTTTYTTNTSAGNTYQWNVAGGTILGSATDTIVSVRWNGSGSGTIILTQTNSFGCDSTVSRSITINPTPTPVISGPSPACAFKATTYTTNTTTGNTYQWNVTGGTILGSSTDTSITVKWNGSGTGSVTLLQTNVSGCDSSVGINIPIRPTPAPVITGPVTVCAFKTYAYNANTTAGNSYQWSMAGGAILGSSTDTIVIVRWNGSGTGTVTLNQTNSFGCDSTVNKIITILTTPFASVSGPLSVCAFRTSTYTTNATTGNTYLWNVTGGTIQGSTTDTILTVKWNTSGMGYVTLTQTNPTGCDSALSKAVTINPTPTPLITGPATVCAFKTYAYNTNTTSGNTYQWIVTGGVIQGSSTDTLVIVKWNGNGAGSVALTQTSSSGCDSVISKSVSILPTPAPVINGPSPVCAYKTVSYGTNVVAGNTYQWAAIGGTILGSSNDTVVSVRWNANATGTIQVTQTNPSGCDSTMNRTITIDPTPLTAIAGSSLVCAYKTTTYTTNTTSGNTYQWIVTGGTITGSSTDTMISVKWNGSGVGSVSLTQTSIPGCDSMVSRTITIRPTPASVITGPGTVCAFKTYTYGTNTAAGSAYQWSITGGTLLSNATDSSVSVRWNTNGTGSISLTQTNAAGCDSTVSRTITIQPSPYTTISGSPSLCANTISVYNTNTTTGNTYQWSVTGGTIQGSNTDTMITVSWGSAGAGSVTLKQQNMIGCDSSVTLPITINAKPVPVFIGPSSVCEFKQNVYSINKTAGSTYQWSVTGGTISGTTTDTIIHVQWNAKGAGTITLKEINAALCDSDITKNIIIRATPVPVMNGPVLVCEYKTTAYSTNTTAGNSYQWTVTGGTILGSATDTVIAVKWGPTGKGTIAVKQVNTFGCDSLVSETITIQPTPVPLITGPASVCAGQQAVYNSNIVSGITYNWSVTGGAVTGSNIDSAVTVRWNNAGPGVITLKQTNSFGCDSIITYAVVIHALPVPIISGNDTICAYKFSAHSTPVVPGHRYRWKATGGTISGSDTLSSTGIYWDDQLVARVTLTLINAAGCDSTVFKDIVVKKAPKPVITGDTMVCRFGQYRYKTDTITGATYKWTITAGAVFGSSVDTAVNVLWSNATTGKIQLLVTNSNGCDSLVSKQASIVDRVHSSISGPDTVCLRKLAVFSVPAVSGHSYLWSATGGTILSDTTKSTVTVMWTSTGNKTISLYERTAADCDTALLKKIFVKPTPVPVISGPATLCAYTKGIYTVRNAVSDTFKWVVTGGVIESMISDTQVVVKWGGSTAGNVQLKQINKEGCDSTAAFNVTIQHAPIPVINGKLNVCAYRTERYSSLYEPGATYNWNVSGGTLNKLHDTLVEVKWHQDGAAGITLQMISPSLCDSTVSKAVSIQATPDPDFSGPMMPCANSVAGYAVSAIPGHSYSWSVSGGTIQGSTTLAFVNVLWGAGGSGSLSLRQQSPLGCDSTIVKFIDIKTHPVPVIHGSAIACTGVSAYTYKATPTGAYAYHWTIQGGRILSGAGTSDIEVNWPLTGTHELTLQITDTITTCDSTVTLTILVDSVIKPEINATALAGCVPLKVVFSGNQALPGYTYHWDFGNGNFSSNVNPEYVYTQPGQFEIKVVVTTSTGCKDSAMTPAAVSYIPVADFEYEFQNDRIYANEDTVKFINRSQGGNLFLWQISSDSLDTIVNPETMYHSPGFYTVKLTTIDTTTGCEQSTTRKLEVRVRERLYTPNAFTPNGDGINDYFSVSVTNIVEFEVLIFDRWGAIMYRSNDPKFKWDGSFDNAPAQADVYGYTINAKGYHGKIFTQSGNVTLLR